MFKKYAILFGVLIALLLLIIATQYYPGGSQHDKNSIGYDWKNNYLSNLFSQNAVNGSPNASRPWAIAGMLFLCSSFALFFVDFSKKITLKSASIIIRYCGVVAMLFGFLAVTPYHDTVIRIASTLALISMFYIVVFVFKSKLHLFKVLSIICMLVFYCCNYLYYTRSYLELLPIMQKTLLLIIIIWVLSLQYFTTSADFRPRNSIATQADDMPVSH
jgi:hypothetical protein